MPAVNAQAGSTCGTTRAVPILTAIALAGVLCSPARAEPNKAAYELSERCGKRAEEVFARDRKGLSILDGFDLHYLNHYNARLNKCFYLKTEDIASHRKGDVGTRTIKLIDLNENRDYGLYGETIPFLDSDHQLMPSVTLNCQVQSKHCTSKDEWDALIKPYMEE